MPHIHYWEPYKTETKRYWLGDLVKKTTYKCRGCEDRMIRTTTPTGRLELAIVLLLGLVGFIFIAFVRHHP